MRSENSMATRCGSSLLVDLTGTQCGWLTVLRRSGRIMWRGGEGSPAWLCRCICGTYKRFDGRTLRNGVSQDCGCRSALIKRTAMAAAILLGEADLGDLIKALDVGHVLTDDLASRMETLESLRKGSGK